MQNRTWGHMLPEWGGGGGDGAPKCGLGGSGISDAAATDLNCTSITSAR
jgi:hypothetical protein